MSGFNFLSFQQLEKNINGLLAVEQKKKKLPTERKAQILLAHQTLRELNESSLSDLEKSKIAMGVMYKIKNDIKYTYNNGIWAYLSYLFKPENSDLYRGIDNALGVTEKNKMHVVLKKQLLASYQDFATCADHDYATKAKKAWINEIEQFNIKNLKSIGKDKSKPKSKPKKLPAMDIADPYYYMDEKAKLRHSLFGQVIQQIKSFDKETLTVSDQSNETRFLSKIKL